jgi:AraC-like DNA-binding protein
VKQPLVYAEQAPSTALAAHVRCYWAITGEALELGTSWRVLPDGCADVIFDFGRGARWVGTMTRAVDVVRSGRWDVFGIRFAPGGLHAFSGLPLHPFTDRNVRLDAVDPLHLLDLEDELAELASFRQRCRLAERVLAGALPRAKSIEIAPMLAWLDACDELPRVHSLASRVGMTSRTLERRFRDALGIGPKQHLRFLRVERARRLIEKRGLQGAEIAAAAYFADEAHFIHEFRRITGRTPGAYRREMFGRRAML